MKIAIYGGAFDPIGRHHEKIAHALLEVVDEVWIMPSYRSMKGKIMAPAEDRLEMCRLAFQGKERIFVSDHEVKTRLSSEEAVRKLLVESKKDFYYVMGADNALSATQWPRFQESISLLPYIIIARPGVEVPSGFWCCHPPHLYLKELSVQGSSTEIREAVRNEGRSDQVSSQVLDYIQSRRLYQ